MSEYRINPDGYTNMFACPRCVTEKYIKIASHLQLQSLLLLASGQDEKQISQTLNINRSDVCDALDFWVQLGTVMKNGEKEAVANITQNPEKAKKTVTKSKITAHEAAVRCEQDNGLRELISETQRVLNRIISASELSTLVWLHDDRGLEPAVILMAVQYAAHEGIKGFKYIENMCVGWADDGVESVQQAEESLKKMYLQKSAWGLVEAAFGIPHRKAGKKENEMSDRWVNKWGFDRLMLEAAYDRCVDTTGKPSFAYIDKILSKWHDAGITKPEDITDEKKEEKNGKKSYDVDKIKNNFNNFD